MTNMPLSWKIGIDNVTAEAKLPHGAVRDAVNVDFAEGGVVSRRGGIGYLSSGIAHSMWSSPTTGKSFCIYARWISALEFSTASGSSLTDDGVTRSEVGMHGTVTIKRLYLLRSESHASWDDLLDGVVCCTKDEVLFIKDGAVSALGVEDPRPISVAASASGGLDAGRYGVIMTYMRGNEESGATPSEQTDVGAGGGLVISIPQPMDAAITAARIYRTQANGDVYYQVAVVPIGMTTYLVGAGPVGHQCQTRYLSRINGGDIVRHWRGRLLVARGRNLLFSEPMKYGSRSLTDGFVQFPRPIRIMQPVESGVFVGTDHGVSFLSGTSPNEWTYKTTGAKPVVRGTGIKISSADLNNESGGGGNYVAVWLSANGFVVGMPDGSISEPQSKRIELSDEQVNGCGFVGFNAGRLTAFIA